MIVVATYLSALRFVGVLVAVYSFVRGLPSFPTRRSSDLAHGDVLQITLALSAGTDPHDHRQVPHLGNAELRRIGPGRDLRGTARHRGADGADTFAGSDGAGIRAGVDGIAVGAAGEGLRASSPEPSGGA